MSDEKYEGWTNRETWAYNLWLSNEEGTYKTINEMARSAIRKSKKEAGGNAPMAIGHLSHDLKDFLDEVVEHARDGNAEAFKMVDDIGSRWRIDYGEIAKNWINDLGWLEVI